MPDSQLIGILIAAMVAGVVLFRLYTVLGRRTGHEPSHEQPASRAPAPSPLRAPAAPEVLPPEGACARGLMDIEMADPGFDRGHFLKGARTAYELIQKAYADSDRIALKPLLSDDVYAAFEHEIAARNNNKGGVANRLGQILDARIVGAVLEGKLADITVAFRALFATPDGGQREIADHWSFARAIGAPDPNWTLVATTGEPA
jgi:predicted lipid-binding transport protein (Tim44 family)